MPEQPGAHPAEESLERYIMNRLDDDEIENLEEHLLICEQCRNRLDAAESYVASVRHAARELASERLQEPTPIPWWKSFTHWQPLRPAAMILAAASVFLFAVLVWRPGAGPEPRPWRPVALETWRGEAANTAVPAGDPLLLRLNTEGLPETALDLHVVAANGAVAVRASVRPASGWAEFRHAPGLPAGAYWVRLSDGESLLREYALQVTSDGP